MASTYSDLKFELIGTGEQDGTWGDTTNTNLGTAIEEAIAGRANAVFTADADLTLTLTNTNTTQVARHYILNVTSTDPLSTTRNLVVPTIDKPYIIENNTTGGRDIVVKTSAGTGVTVPNGKKMMVYANSTDVVEAFDQVGTLTAGTLTAGTLTAGTLTLTSPLTVPNGGTGAATLTGYVKGSGTSALTGSATIPNTDITGLGTISTQNANNVAITGGSITGITDLGVADGGTGASSFTANSVLLGNGTSSFQTVAPGTSGNVLTSNGTTWTSATPATQQFFPAGTRMSFNQTAAPTGWTKDTTAALNDSIMRIVTGTVGSGGSLAFSSFAAQTTTGAHTLTTAEIPSHAHNQRRWSSGVTSNSQAPLTASTGGQSSGPTDWPAGPLATASTGGGGAHSHTLSQNLKYYDFIIASKD